MTSILYSLCSLLALSGIKASSSTHGCSSSIFIVLKLSNSSCTRSNEHSSNVTGRHRLSEEEVSEWLSSDQHDQGYIYLSEDEIISSVIHQDEEPEEEEPNDDAYLEDQDSTISHSTAVKLFDQCLLCLQQQEEASLYNVGVLQELRDFAARKRRNSIKQTKVSDYFTPI